MKLYDFVKLSMEQQTEAASRGVLLGEREAKPYVIFLFNVGNFYVEVFFNDIQNRITRIKPFKAIRLLEPYLNDVIIEKLQ